MGVGDPRRQEVEDEDEDDPLMRELDGKDLEDVEDVEEKEEEEEVRRLKKIGQTNPPCHFIIGYNRRHYIM